MTLLLYLLVSLEELFLDKEILPEIIMEEIIIRLVFQDGSLVEA